MSDVIHVISWNILLYAYEKKYYPNSKILNSYPDNNIRLREIISKIKYISNYQTIICLQECSEDILSLLRSAFCLTHDIFYQIVDEGECEYIITLVPKMLECVLEDLSIPVVARGYLVVSNINIKIVNCHLYPQFKFKKVKVLNTLRNEPMKKITVFAGDFNERHNKVSAFLRDKYVTPYFGLSYKGKKDLDHIVVNRATRYTVNICDTGLLSDHNPIYMEFDIVKNLCIYNKDDLLIKQM
jgi:hypothetical protein